MVDSNKTHRATSTRREYKTSHLYITFTKIHFILKIFSVQLQRTLNKSYCIFANKETVPLITTKVEKQKCSQI